MNIYINNRQEIIPDEVMSVADLVKWKNLEGNSLAVAIDNRIVRKPEWENTYLKDMCSITLFSAAFGG